MDDGLAASIDAETLSSNADMGMDDPVPTFGYLVNQLKERYPSLAYIHVVSPHSMGNEVPKDESVRTFI